jgi:3-oxoacyl-[acyl-carrier-protein] synthase-3
MTSVDPRIGLLGVGAYLPSRIMSNEEWTQYVDTSPEWIFSRTGIERRRIAADDETTSSLAAAAALDALQRASMTVAEIAEIIVATDTPEVTSPDTAAFVQHRLGAPEIPAWDMAGSGCAGFVQALDVARARVLLRGAPVLVIGVELLSRRFNWKDRNTAVLFGDGAGAAVVGTGPRTARIVAATAGTDGSKTGILGIEVGGSRRPFTLEEAVREGHKTLTMDGRQVFREAVRRMSAAAREVLRQAGVTFADVALAVPHQANARILQAVAESLGIPPERVASNVHEYGNIGSASIPVALWHAENENRIRPGDLVLLTAFGAGFHWSAMLLEYPR